MVGKVDKFKLGQSNIESLYIGDQNVERIFYGEQLVWGFPAPTIMEFVEKIDNITNTPTIPNYVDDSHIAFLLEYSTSSNNIILPSGWQRIILEPSIGNRISASYKILSISDRDVIVNGLGGTSNRDQVYIFKKSNNKPINYAQPGNSVYTSATGATPIANAPTIFPNQSSIIIHYFYNTGTGNPTISATPAMDQQLISSLSSFYGGQYKIYNESIPVDTVATAGLSGSTIRQILFWMVVE